MTEFSPVPSSVLRSALALTIPPPDSPPADPPDADVIATTLHGRHAEGLLVMRIAVLPFRNTRPRRDQCVEFEALAPFPPRLWLTQYLGPAPDAPGLKWAPDRFRPLALPGANEEGTPEGFDITSWLPGSLAQEQARWPGRFSRRAATAFLDDLQALSSVALDCQRSGRLIVGHQALTDMLFVLSLLQAVNMPLHFPPHQVVDTGLIAKGQAIEALPQTDEDLLTWQCRIARSSGAVPALAIDPDDRPTMPPPTRPTGQLVPSHASTLASASAVEYLRQWTVALGD